MEPSAKRAEPAELPVVASCSLDPEALGRQRERYRRVSDGARLLQRTPRRLVVEVAPQAAEVVPKLIAVESECCPFFSLGWEEESRRFNIAVAERDHEPALAAIAHALSL